MQVPEDSLFFDDEVEQVEVAEDADEFEEPSLLDRFDSASLMHVPGPFQLMLWDKVLKHKPVWGKNAWLSLKVSHILKKWTGHPSASMFTAPDPDPELEAPTFPDQVSLEVKLTSLMNSVGGLGAIATRVIACYEERGDQLKETAAKFRDGSIAVENPREEAAAILMAMKDTLKVDWAKDMTDLARIVASLYNSMLGMRR